MAHQNIVLQEILRQLPLVRINALLSEHQAAPAPRQSRLSDFPGRSHPRLPGFDSFQRISRICYLW